MKTSVYIKNKVHKLSLETGVNPNIILRHFIFEFFLEKLDKSKYCSQFVIKGGFLISSWISIDHRTTMDLDLTVKSFLLTKENLRLSIHEILTIETIQDLTMALVDIEEIRENDQYPGFRATILVLLDGLRERIKIDFTTGDLITPSPIIYHYRKILDQNVLKLHTYNFETVISEKMETILSRGIFNTRLRDFYDVFTIWKLMRKDIVIDTLRHAFDNTSLYRNNKKFKLEEVLQRIDMLETDHKIIEQWGVYQANNAYAKNVKFVETIAAVKEICLNSINA